MPMDRKRYPKNWNEIAFRVKDAADWKCQICGVQCYRPNEKVEDHGRILTVMHLNHTPEDCRPENLLAGCGNLNLLRNGKFLFLASGHGHRNNGDNHPQIQWLFHMWVYVIC